MRLVPETEFLAWAQAYGIGWDDRQGSHDLLAYRPYRNLSRFWLWPENPREWTFLVATMLDAIGPWDSVYVWFRGGAFPELTERCDANEQLRAILFRDAGIPDGYAGALQLDRAERYRILALAFVQMAFGWCASDDVCLFPDPARAFLRISHHEIIDVDFSERKLIRSFVKQMETSGYPLPTDVPDATFLRPRWMKPRAASR